MLTWIFEEPHHFVNPSRSCKIGKNTRILWINCFLILDAGSFKLQNLNCPNFDHSNCSFPAWKPEEIYSLKWPAGATYQTSSSLAPFFNQFVWPWYTIYNRWAEKTISKALIGSCLWLAPHSDLDFLRKLFINLNRS